MNKIPSRKSTRNRRNGDKEKAKISLIEYLVFSPLVVVILLLLLAFITKPMFIHQSLGNLFFSFLGLSVLAPGIYYGWMSWFQGEHTKQRIINNLSNSKESLGCFYRIYTLFLPDRFIPTYLLYVVRFASLLFIYTGVMIFLTMLE